VKSLRANAEHKNQSFKVGCLVEPVTFDLRVVESHLTQPCFNARFSQSQSSIFYA
jgi:BarA-like signal transduction histidine kinase